MTIVEAIVLGVLQGVAEFLPISSSGHLVLVPWWLGWEEPPLVFDVVVHVATTVAILLYFWRDWLALAQAGLALLQTRRVESFQQKLLLLLIVSTIPAVIAGLLLESYFESIFSEPALVALMLYVTAAMLIFSERYGQQGRDLESMTGRDALWVGLAQGLAIIPGISRSGSTIAAGLLRQFSRPEAARYSFLMATPIIIGAGAKQFLDLALGAESLPPDMGGALLAGFGAALLTGYGAIVLLLRLVRQYTLYGFALYCILFGTVSFLAALL